MPQKIAEWVDISVPIYPGMACWPGDPDVQTTWVQEMDRGDSCNVTHLELGAHSGTHIDAPLHYLHEGAAIDALPFAATVGPARVIEIHDPAAVLREELERAELRAGERILFKTRNSRRTWHNQPFNEDFVHIAAEGARYLVERRIQTVGLDYLSVGGYQRDGEETHQILLSAGVWIIEGLDLNGIDPGVYELVCLPLRLRGAEGAPARAILRQG